MPERGVVTARVVVQLGDCEAGRDAVLRGERRIGEQGFKPPHRVVRGGDAAGHRQVAPRIGEPRLNCERAPEAICRRLELSGGAERAPQPVPRLGEARRARDGPAEALRCTGDVVCPVLGQSHRMQSGRIVRQQRERAPVAGECGGEAFALHQQQAERAQRRGTRRIEPQCAAQADLRRAEAPLMEQSEAKLRVRLDKLRRQGERPPRGRLRRRVVAAFPLGTGKVRVHVGHVGAKFDRAGVACHRLRSTSGQPQRIAEIGVSIGKFGKPR